MLFYFFYIYSINLSCIFKITDVLSNSLVQNLLENKVLLFVLLLSFNVLIANHFDLNYQIPLRLCRNRDHHAIEPHFLNIVFESAKH
jgi:hypothetical protein